MHMAGDLHAKTMQMQPFTTEELHTIESFHPHNLQHNSMADQSAINSRSLPPNRQSTKDCTVDELKSMLIVRGGTCTDGKGNAMRKEELIQIVDAYLLMEKENPVFTVYYNRSREHNGHQSAKFCASNDS